MRSVRVVVLVSEEGSPELYRAIESVPPRLRAERLRTLATVGLLGLEGKSPSPLERNTQAVPVKVRDLARTLWESL